MKSKVLTGLLICSMAVLSSSCSKDKVPLEGERIAVLQSKTVLTPDYAPGEVQIKLPKPKTNDEWSQKGGNSYHSMQHLMSSDKLKEKWSSSFGSGSSKRDFLIAEPVIAHNTVFAIDVNAVVSAFRIDNGKRLWKRKLKPLNSKDKDVAIKGAGIAVYGDRVYATTGFGGIFSIDVVNGKVVWKKYIGTPLRIAPTVGGGKIFVQTIDNMIMALDPKNGQEIWKHKSDVEATTFVGGANPTYSEELDVLLAAFNNGELRAFKASTGSPLWADYLVARKRTNSLSNINSIKANPVIDKDKVYALGNNSVLVAIDLRSGMRVWEREVGGTNQPWLAGNYLYVLTNDNDLFAVDKTNGKIIWNTNIPVATNIEDKVGVFVSGPVLTDNRLIVATSNGYAFSVSPYTGKILSFITLGEDVVLPPIVGHDTVIFTSSDAELIAFR
ncbi:MAG: PQQ-binding-like beta-propeller repeat protein [Lactobacillus sp.]|jgi:outer membrane protein assembly factor BamB|nr:PQQ-binding-like beta-propeller repeat protein [Lactobacillus sp.]